MDASRAWRFVTTTLSAAALGFAACVAVADRGLAQSDVWLRHSPAHPAGDEAVWVAVRALGGPYEVITVRYDVYELSDNGTAFPNQTLITENQDGGTCRPQEVLNETWCFKKLNAFGDNRLVNIVASAAPAIGGELASESYLFAAGDYPGPGPIPIRRTGPIESRVDVVLVPETGSLDSTDPDRAAALRIFSGRLSSFINDIFFSFEPYGGFPGNPYRRLYNFYYARNPTPLADASAAPCTPATLPSDKAALELNFDAMALLHCRDPESAGTKHGYDRSPAVDTSDACGRHRDYKCTGSKFMTSEIDYSKSVGHEMGHLLHQLTDEYCDSRTAYHLAPTHANVFRTVASCQRAAARLGYPSDGCAPICPFGFPTPFWKIEHPAEPSSIMDRGMHEIHSQFFNSSIVRVLYTYLDCLDNEVCYDDSVGDASAVASSASNASELALAAEVGPDDGRMSVADMASSESMRAANTKASGGRRAAELEVSRSLLELQQRLRDPLEGLGRKAPAEATTRTSNALEPEADVNLGLRVEINGADGRVLGVAPITSAAPASVGGGPTITVVGEGEGGEHVFAVEVPDTRWVEFEGTEWRQARSGTITVPLPTTRGLREIVLQSHVAPGTLAPESMTTTTDGPTNFSVTLDRPELRLSVESAIVEACKEYRTAAACR